MDVSRMNIQNVFGGKKLTVSLRRINHKLICESDYSECSSVSDSSLISDDIDTMNKKNDASIVTINNENDVNIIVIDDENETNHTKVNKSNALDNITINAKEQSLVITNNINKQDVTMNNESDKIIGQGISFVDPEFVTTKLGKKKRVVNQELQEKKKLEKEAHEKEIQEKQYKRLMHLLTKSKAFSNFISTRFNEDLKKKNKRMDKKRKKYPENYSSSPSKKEKLSSNFISNNTEIKNKTKLNLSNEKISEQLAYMSDDESNNKENIISEHDFTNPIYFKGELRDYQTEGVNWLKVLYENGLNGILADEMGLGKTVEIIAFFAHLIQKNICGPFLIIVPLSTLPNWISEFERFAPQIPVLVCYRKMEAHRVLRDKISKKKFLSPTCSTYPVVLTTYNGILKESELLKPFHWKYIVIDEAQRIKNYKSKLFIALKGYKSLNRLLLTGTPLQNNLSELWALLNFLLPEIFNDLDVFNSWFDAKQVRDEDGKMKLFQQEEEKQVLSILREILDPFMLRRLKEDVCSDIPLLKEILVYAPLTKPQYDLYSAVLNMNINSNYNNDLDVAIVDIDGVRPKRKCTKQFNSKAGCFESKNNQLDEIKKLDYKNKISIKEIELWSKFITITNENIGYIINMKTRNYQMIYRHVVNHPYGIYNPIHEFGVEKYFDDILKLSGKLLVLDAMLQKLKNNNHKVLLFSTLATVLNILEDYLTSKNYKYSRLDGSQSFDERKNNIEQFNNDPEVFLFLLTTKAGGVGLNLTAADTVIIYDSDWNPQNDLQAMARCHRIGQIKPVAVYRLCTKGTVDEEIIKRANAKRFLEKAVIAKAEKSLFTNEGLLKLKSLFDTVDSNSIVLDPKKKVYTEAEINQLLDRSNW